MHTMPRTAAVDFSLRTAAKRFEDQVATSLAHSTKFSTVNASVCRMNGMVSHMLKDETGVNDKHILMHARAAFEAASDAVVDVALSKIHRISAQRNLMIVLTARQRHADAIDNGQLALSDSKRVLGSMHPMTLAITRELSVILLDIGDFVGAEPLLRDAEHGCVELLGEKNTETLSARLLLGQLIARQGDLDGAKQLFRKCLRTARKLHGDAAPLTMMATSHLGAVLMERTEYFEAEALLSWHLKVVRRAHGASAPEVEEAALRLAMCQRAAGDVSAAFTADEVIGSCGKACSSCAKASSCGSNEV